MKPRSAYRLAVLTAAALIGAGVLPALGQARHDVDVADNSYAPTRIEVQTGDTVVWTHTGSNPHSVTAADGSFDSHPACPPSCMGQGDTFEHQFTTAGEFSYYCKIHGSGDGAGMAGTVVVSAAPEPEPEPEPTPEPEAQPDAVEGEPEPTDAQQELASTGSPLLLLLLGLTLTGGGFLLRAR